MSIGSTQVTVPVYCGVYLESGDGQGFTKDIQFSGSGFSLGFFPFSNISGSITGLYNPDGTPYQGGPALPIILNPSPFMGPPNSLSLSVDQVDGLFVATSNVVLPPGVLAILELTFHVSIELDGSDESEFVVDYGTVIVAPEDGTYTSIAFSVGVPIDYDFELTIPDAATEHNFTDDDDITVTIPVNPHVRLRGESEDFRSSGVEIPVTVTGADTQTTGFLSLIFTVYMTFSL